MRGMRLATVSAVLVAAMAMMTFGASSASASTEFCKVSTSPCPSGSAYLAGSTFKVTGEFKLINGVADCEVEYEFTTTTSSGPSIEAEVKSFKLTHCVSGTVTAEHLPWLFEAEVILTGPNGNSKMAHLGKGGTPEFEVSSTGCVYRPTGTVIPQKITGGTSISTGSAVPMTGGTGCTATELVMAATPKPSFYVTN